MNAFAQKCGIGESLMRKYLAGSSPGAENLAQVARANDVSVEWLVTGEGPRSRSVLLQMEQMRGGGEYSMNRVEQPAASYRTVNLTMLSAALAAVSSLPLMAEDGKRKVATAWYELMTGKGSTTDADLLTQFFDAVAEAVEIGRGQQPDLEWPLVERRHAARRKTDPKP